MAPSPHVSSTCAQLQPMLTAQDVAGILAVPLHRVYELTRQEILPHMRIGRQVRYDPERLRSWIDAGGTSVAHAIEGRPDAR